ncbi:MAG: WcaI family glycosyltransferase [Firmicutes bacterium]|nr:WcaI family glycosyltransferase [Bacillota bacterium]
MRLLFYGINYAPEPTGTGPYTTDMARWLADRGHQVDVITGLPHYPAWKVDEAYAGLCFLREEIDGVRVLRVPLRTPKGSVPSSRDRIVLESSFALAAGRYWLPCMLVRQRYDAVIAICPPLQMGVYPQLYHGLRGVPWIFHIQDLQVDAAFRLGMLQPSSASRLLYRVENGLLRQASLVSTNTDAMRRRIIEKGTPPERTFLLPNWADLQAITPLPKQNAFREQLGIPEDHVLCIYAGSMGAKQGLETAIDAARQLQDETHIHFAFVGDGARRKVLEEQARGIPNITLLPVQPKERLAEMLAAADVHLVVQRRDAADLVMPSKLGNILAAGRPVVATAEPGTALYETVTQAGAGLLVPPEQPELLAAAIRRLAKEETFRTTCGRNGRQWAETHLSIDVLMPPFEQRLKALVQSSLR